MIRSDQSSAVVDQHEDQLVKIIAKPLLIIFVDS